MHSLALIEEQPARPASRPRPIRAEYAIRMRASYPPALVAGVSSFTGPAEGTLLQRPAGPWRRETGHRQHSGPRGRAGIPAPSGLFRRDVRVQPEQVVRV